MLEKKYWTDHQRFFEKTLSRKLTWNLKICDENFWRKTKAKTNRFDNYKLEYFAEKYEENRAWSSSVLFRPFGERLAELEMDYLRLTDSLREKCFSKNFLRELFELFKHDLRVFYVKFENRNEFSSKVHNNQLLNQLFMDITEH